MNYLSSVACFLLSISSALANVGGVQPYVMNNFIEQASSSAVIVVGQPMYLIDGYPELTDVYESHRFYYVKIIRTLAATPEYVNRDGLVELPEYLLISDNLGLGQDNYSSRCPSVFFLWPVFTDDSGRHLNSNRELVSKVLDSQEYQVDRSRVFELASGEEVFPIINFKTLKDDYPHLAPFEEQEVLWSRWESRLEEYWGLSDLSEVEGFSKKALLPFFRQIDTKWFCAEVEGLNAKNPLNRIAEFFWEQEIPDANCIDPEGVRPLGAIRRPFIGGTVLEEYNLSKHFRDEIPDS